MSRQTVIAAVDRLVRPNRFPPVTDRVLRSPADEEQGNYRSYQLALQSGAIVPPPARPFELLNCAGISAEVFPNIVIPAGTVFDQNVMIQAPMESQITDFMGIIWFNQIGEPFPLGLVGSPPRFLSRFDFSQAILFSPGYPCRIERPFKRLFVEVPIFDAVVGSMVQIRLNVNIRLRDPRT